MDQIEGLPQNYGMNAVIEPLDFKLPITSLTESEKSVMKSPPREYPVSLACDPPAAVSSQISPAPLVDPHPETSSQVTVCPTSVCPVVDAPLVTSCHLPLVAPEPLVTHTVFSPDPVLTTASPRFTSVAPSPPVISALPAVSSVPPDTTPVTAVSVLPDSTPVSTTSVAPDPTPVVVTSVPSESSPVRSPVRVATHSPLEAWVNPFSILLRSFDEDPHEPSPTSGPVSVSSVPQPEPVCEPHVVTTTEPSVPVSECPVPPDPEKRGSLTNDHSGIGTDMSPSRTSHRQTPGTPESLDIASHVKSEDTKAGRVDERRSSLGSVPSSFKARTGALLPTIPCQTKTLRALREERSCVRTGSLGEQEFVQQLRSGNEGLTAGSTSQIRQFAGDLIDNLNFDVDDEYENEGEESGDDDEDDDELDAEGVDKFACDTIVEESEEESLSPRSVQTIFDPNKRLETRERTRSSPLSSPVTGPDTRPSGGSGGSMLSLSRVPCSSPCLVILMSSSCSTSSS